MQCAVPPSATSAGSALAPPRPLRSAAACGRTWRARACRALKAAGRRRTPGTQTWSPTGARASGRCLLPAAAAGYTCLSQRSDSPLPALPSGWEEAAGQRPAPQPTAALRCRCRRLQAADAFRLPSRSVGPPARPTPAGTLTRGRAGGCGTPAGAATTWPPARTLAGRWCAWSASAATASWRRARSATTAIWRWGGQAGG